MKTALLVGGTAATGVAIAADLQARGYQVTIYHRGEHEVDDLHHLEHIHGDPHDPGAIDKDLAGREWDITVATYGRIRHIAQALRGRTGQFVSISGMPVVSLGHGVPVTEAHPYETLEGAPAGLKGLLPKIIETEQAVLACHAAGDFVATVVRYPYVYGPYSVVPMEWHVIRRILDQRRSWILQGAGLAISGRCAAPNAARVVGLALDKPEVAGGQVYHAADTRQFTQREWITMVADAMDYQFEFIDIPSSVSPLGWSAVPMAGEYTWARGADTRSGIQRHALVSNEKARIELGYEDVVEPAAWIRKTVAYWLANPPVIDGRAGRFLPAEFDYEAEDSLVAFWRGVLAQAPSFGVPLLKSHPYDHPAKGKTFAPVA
jgi:nucleoside-diphosphate-sugar epimerase